MQGGVVRYGKAPETVFILGAGFSRALASNMPLTLDIGREVELRLRKTERRSPIPVLAEIGFENWMTWLAQRQPFQTDSDYFENRRLFAVVQSAVAASVREAQLAARERPRPRWLNGLIELWHAQRSTVITMNYDTLVEDQIRTLGLFTGFGDPVLAGDATLYITANSASATYGRDSVADTFRLLKLHGSIDWHWVPGDQSGASVTTADFKSNATPAEAYAAQARLAGREVFIVPPLQAKSDYLTNPISRFVWQHAMSSLLEAQRVVLIGYSLPLEDSGVASMLHRALTTNTDATVTVVNLNPSTVATKVTQLGVSHGRVDAFPAKDAIARFSFQEVDSVAAQIAAQLRELTTTRPAAPIGISIEESYAYPFSITFRAARSERLLRSQSVDHPGQMPRPNVRRYEDGTIPALTMREVFEPGDDAGIVRVQLGGRSYTVVGFEEDRNIESTSPPQSDDWIILRAVRSAEA